MLVSNGDVRIDVAVSGNGDDTVVLIHGFPLSRRDLGCAGARAIGARSRGRNGPARHGRIDVSPTVRT